MDDDKTNINIISIGFCEMLTLVFIAFKLANIIDWSWWLVLMPIWIQISAVLILIFGFLTYYIWLVYCDSKEF